MLPASNRLRRSDEFRRAVRTGRRAGRRALVVHLLPGPGSAAEPARVGFVVNKAVGNAVLRNRVHRRLRAVMATQLSGLPAGSLTVVRALPPSATSSYDELVADVLGALRRVLPEPVKAAPAGTAPLSTVPTSDGR
ncbi:ribonuclease P protein component [Kribbella sp. NPDC056861]|uniref:ribonuclease P protein component n=1 Tax=Kribbella sp. NPDC056861 TaxID=3154857 RepID=UPI00343454D3